jgi:hypothetical protein
MVRWQVGTGAAHPAAYQAVRAGYCTTSGSGVRMIRKPALAPAIVRALALALDPAQGITWLDPDPADVVLLVRATGLTAYDASYLCAAAMAEADLLTADDQLASAVDPFVGVAGP